MDADNAENPKFTRRQENLIAAFRGLPRDARRSRVRRSRQIDDLLDSVLERYQVQTRTARDVLMENWVSIVGGGYAHRCCPVEITARGELVIRVASATLRSELAFFERRLLQKIRALELCGRIKKIILRAG